MRFPGNCFVVSVIAALLPGKRLWYGRNRMGRIHFFWKDKYGRSWEFYKRGASSKTYLQNSIYIGEIKKVR
jgi:hypothetical protein